MSLALPFAYGMVLDVSLSRANQPGAVLAVFFTLFFAGVPLICLQLCHQRHRADLTVFVSPALVEGVLIGALVFWPLASRQARNSPLSALMRAALKVGQPPPRPCAIA